MRLNLSERTATIAALAYAALFPIDYFLLSHEFLPATVHLVFFLAVVKILTASTNRDNLYIAVIAFLELLAAAILSINFNFFLVPGAVSAVRHRGAHQRRNPPLHAKAPTTARAGLKHFHSRLALLAAWIALGILTLTAGMFFLLPRTADAALSTLTSHHIHVPGYSDRVTLGEIGEFKISSRRRHAHRHLPQPADGLGQMARRRAHRFRRPRLVAAGLDSADRGAVAESAGTSRSALTPGRTAQLSRGIHRPGIANAVLRRHAGERRRICRKAPGRTRDRSAFACGQPQPSGFRYDASACSKSRRKPPRRPIRRRFWSWRHRERVPATPVLDPRIPLLAQSMTAGADTDLARARAMEQRLAHRITATPWNFRSGKSADPLANFLFTRRKGHCEYFASAMAVMLRTVGIPSRLVTGFQKRRLQSHHGLWVVRASDAHSWVEAWIPGRGWSTFDPTPPDLSAHPPHPVLQGWAVPGCRGNLLAAMGSRLRSQPPGNPGRSLGANRSPPGHRLARFALG